MPEFSLTDFINNTGFNFFVNGQDHLVVRKGSALEPEFQVSIPVNWELLSRREVNPSTKYFQPNQIVYNQGENVENQIKLWISVDLEDRGGFSIEYMNAEEIEEHFIELSHNKLPLEVLQEFVALLDKYIVQG